MKVLRASLISLPILLSVSVVKLAEACQLSLPPLTLRSGSSLARVEFTLLHAAVLEWRNIPIGWNMTIDNDPSWQLHVSGQAVVGAAFLDPKKFSSISLRSELGFTCETIANAKPRLKLDIYTSDRMQHLTVPAVITGP